MDPLPDQTEEKKGVKRSRNESQMGNDEKIHISKFLQWNSTDEIKGLSISPYTLIGEIQKYEPEFSLESYLTKKRRKIESIEYILYDLLKPHPWVMKVTVETISTKGAIPITISQVYMTLLINANKNEYEKWYGKLHIKDKEAPKGGLQSDTYPLVLFTIPGQKGVYIVLDIEDLSIPNRISYLSQRDEILKFTPENVETNRAMHMCGKPTYGDFHKGF